MKNIEKITEDFKSFLNKIFLLVAKDELSHDSELFRAAAEAMIILNKSEAPKVSLVSRKKLPNMLEHALSVAHYIIEENLSFSEACKKRAKDAGNISVPSVRQGCLSAEAEGLDTTTWNKMAGGDGNAIKIVMDKLLKHYPYQEKEIKETFNRNE